MIRISVGILLFLTFAGCKPRRLDEAGVSKYGARAQTKHN